MTGGRPSLQQKTETHFSKSFLIVSIIASVIFFLLGEVIYRTLITDVNSVFFMGVYFAVFGLILSSAFFIVFQSDWFGYHLKENSGFRDLHSYASGIGDFF